MTLRKTCNLGAAMLFMSAGVMILNHVPAGDYFGVAGALVGLLGLVAERKNL
jgi:hypothetical protein